MYYLSNKVAIMQHVSKFLNLPLINQAILDLEHEHEETRKKKNALRIRIWRLKKIVGSHNQLDLPLVGESK